MTYEDSSKKAANPAPLGLLSFGVTVVTLSLHYLGVIEFNIGIVAMGLVLGGLAQIVAGLIEYRNNNFLIATVFVAYGMLWWSLVIIWVNPFAGTIAPIDGMTMGFYLLMWGIITLFFSICALKENLFTKIVFFSLTAVFLLLSTYDFTGIVAISRVAGIIGVFAGAGAIYIGLAHLVNITYKRNILPLG